jgi:hypothetical protein
LVLLVTLMAVLAWSNVRISEERDQKEAALRAKEQEAAATRAVNEFLQKDLVGQADIANQALRRGQAVGRGGDQP